MYKLISFNFLIFILLSTFGSLTANERDPFLSPFEPKKQAPKPTPQSDEKEAEKNSVSQKPTSQLDEKKTNEIKKNINSGSLEKATAVLTDLKKEIEGKVLSESDNNTLSDFDDEIKNFNKYKDLLKSTRELMTVQGKILLTNKKNILLVNNQPVSEGEDLMDILKLETSIILNEVKDESFTLRIKDIVQSFHIE